MFTGMAILLGAYYYVHWNGVNADFDHTKNSSALFSCRLFFTTASAGEWEIFTGTLIEYDQSVATRNTVEFKNGIELDGRDRVFEKPDIQNKISFGGRFQIYGSRSG